MKKITLLLLAAMILFSCQKKDASSETNVSSSNRNCAIEEVLAAQLSADPSLQGRMDQIEQFTRKAIATGEAKRTLAISTIEIPVVVHILYHTAEENISDAQVKSQIDVLNEDFNLRNRDNRQVPLLFSALKADVGVKFVLAQTIRKFTTKTSWPVADNMKFTARGGSDGIDPANNLNIWVCNIGHGVLGFSYYPGISPDLDGVVVVYNAFGRTGTLLERFDEGRTATHEVGHWLNLHHIWGDKTCGDDLVDDTPKHTTANFDCPEFPHYNSCDDKAIEMTMNYMDYTDDACMFMFSNGQKNRMLAVFATGGPRESFVQ